MLQMDYSLGFVWFQDTSLVAVACDVMQEVSFDTKFV